MKHSKNTITLLSTAVVLSILSASAQCKTVYASKTTGADSNDGLTWETAKSTVGDAINNALDGDEVWVAKGEYVENITLTKGISLYGGFVGDEVARDTRDWNKNATVLDGGAIGCVVAVNNVASNTAIDGFTIQNGKTGYSNKGAGISCSHSAPTIAHNIIKNNTAYNGGGIYCENSAPIVSDNTFSANTASIGAAIYAINSSPVITGNIVKENTANNHTEGIIRIDNAPKELVISDNEITANRGSGIRVYNSLCTISGNSVMSNKGIGVLCDSSTPTILKNIVTGNNIYKGGGIKCTNCKAPFICGNVVSSNIADNFVNYDAEVYCAFSYGSTTICNNTITGGKGYAIRCDQQVTVANNIVAFSANGIYIMATRGLLRNNCIFNANNDSISPTVTDGGGNLRVDPLIPGWKNGDFHMRPDSPCRDAGWNDAAGIGATDIYGQARIQPAGGAIDIGAAESDGVWLPPATVRVSPTGNDLNDGSTWALAKKTVQAALNDCMIREHAEIWVAAGTYTEQITAANGIYLYGGFAGTENAASERAAFPRPSPDPAETILDGNKQCSVVAFIGSGSNCGIDGFTIRNGNGTYVNNNDNDFVGNRIMSTGPSGGGILCITSSPAISHNIITANLCSFGGGIYLKNSSAQITENLITANITTSAFGGGIYAFGGSPFISRNTISKNTSFWSGGMCLWRCANPVVSDNKITGNTSALYGGGMTVVCSNATVSGNLVSGNKASACGGGIDLGLGGSIIASGNLIVNNHANSAGGGIWTDGTIIKPTDTKLTVKLTNNSIVGNSTKQDHGGGAECVSGAIIQAANNLIAFNTSGIRGSAKETTLKNNCIFNPAGSNYIGVEPGAGDININPLLGSNYHLSTGSPCINAGLGDAPGILSMDIDGQPRINGSSIDIGADEWWANAGDVKRMGVGSTVSMRSIVISAAFPDFFYIESDDRSSGVRVDKPSHGLQQGMRVDVDGTMSVNSDGECFISAMSVTQNGFGNVVPVEVNNKSLGGGQFGLQQALWGWVNVRQPDKTTKLMWTASTGLNNVGLLIKTTGKVTFVGDGLFYLDDGSALNDNSEHKGVKVYSSATVAAGQTVTVIGISSCEKPASDPVRVIRTRGAEDISMVL